MENSLKLNEKNINLLDIFAKNVSENEIIVTKQILLILKKS